MAQKTVLIVEDNADSRIIFGTLLSRRGYRVVEAADARSAIARLETDTPDVILLDIGLPHVDGWSVARELRQRDPDGRVPIIMVTAHDTVEQYQQAELYRVADFLCKPIEPTRVLDCVERVIGAPEEQSLTA